MGVYVHIVDGDSVEAPMQVAMWFAGLYGVYVHIVHGDSVEIINV